LAKDLSLPTSAPTNKAKALFSITDNRIVRAFCRAKYSPKRAGKHGEARFYFTFT
jgi:hypothetical protein